MKKYVYPVDLLEKLCVRTLLKRENFEDLNEIDRSLALDKVLTASYRSILTLEDFDKLKAAVNDANPGANVEWNANDDNEVPFVTVEIPSKWINFLSSMTTNHLKKLVYNCSKWIEFFHYLLLLLVNHNSLITSLNMYNW